MISDEARTVEGGMARMSEAAANVKEKAREVGHQAREMGEHAREAAAEKMHELRDRAGDYYKQGRRQAVKLEHRVENYVQEHPMESLLIAAGVGLVAGFFMRHKR